MKFLVTLFLVVAACTGESAQRPNFVIFYVDDLGWSDTSVRMMDSNPDSASDFHQMPHSGLIEGMNQRAAGILRVIP